MSFFHNLNWIDKPIGEVITEIKPGFSWSKTKLVQSGIFHIRPYNISTDLEINLENKVFVPNSIKDIENYFLKKDDILFNNTNSVELVGKTIIMERDLDDA